MPLPFLKFALLPSFKMNDQDFMRLALTEADTAAKLGEIPVGALIVQGEKIIASAHNLKETTQDPTGHAEVLAIKLAAQKLNTWRLEGCKLYVTLEPCLMCSGAILQARLDEVIFATRDPKGGAVVSCCEVFTTPQINHRPNWREGILQEQASLQLKNFFKELRKSK